MQSFILVGGSEEERLKKALDLNGQDLKISKFDTIIIGGETSIGIGQIRQLFHELSLKPYNSKARSAIVHPGELLTVEAQNALLKMLEEARETAFIILTTPQIDLLLSTVTSRCQIIKLAPKTEISLEEEEFKKMIFDLLSIIQSGVGERLKFAETLGKDREEIKLWLIKLLTVCREILLLKSGARVDPQRVNMLTQYGKTPALLTTADLLQTIKEINQTKTMLEQNVNPRLALENLLLAFPKT
ncbi:MAG: hypothetical protein M1575_01835 [Patescibacteria group bacterium]|nr:hypothetical protein [Patescibacteria group bacterium]MCL5095443.1 hypothetical protein [Patescibacteria group bacterium]